MIKITVDCEDNYDVIDLKAGGSEILGFDFYISDEENPEEYITFIKDELKKNGLPLQSIRHHKVNMLTKSWTKEMISKSISKGY